jgi:hypothetical protein
MSMTDTFSQKIKLEGSSAVIATAIKDQYIPQTAFQVTAGCRGKATARGVQDCCYIIREEANMTGFLNNTQTKLDALTVFFNEISVLTYMELTYPSSPFTLQFLGFTLCNQGVFHPTLVFKTDFRVKFDIASATQSVADILPYFIDCVVKPITAVLIALHDGGRYHGNVKSDSLVLLPGSPPHCLLNYYSATAPLRSDGDREKDIEDFRKLIIELANCIKLPMVDLGDLQCFLRPDPRGKEWTFQQLAQHLGIAGCPVGPPVLMVPDRPHKNLTRSQHFRSIVAAQNSVYTPYPQVALMVGHFMANEPGNWRNDACFRDPTDSGPWDDVRRSPKKK